MIAIWGAGRWKNSALAGELMVYKHTGFWAGMNTLSDVAYLNDLWSWN